MDCTLIERLIEPYLNKELDREHFYLVKKHIKGCALCRAKVRELSGRNPFLKIFFVISVISIPIFLIVLSTNKNEIFRKEPVKKRVIEIGKNEIDEKRPIEEETIKKEAVEKEPIEKTAVEKDAKKVVSNIIIEIFSRDSEGDAKIIKDIANNFNVEIADEEPLAIKLAQNKVTEFIENLNKVLPFPEGTPEKVKEFINPLKETDEVIVKIKFLKNESSF